MTASRTLVPAAATAAPTLTAPRRIRGQAAVGAGIGIVVLFAAWVIVARRQPELIVPSPVETWRALVDLASEGDLYRELRRTVLRSVTGVLLALLVGVTWGALNGRSTWAASISQPALSTLMALPPVVLVALGMVWFGPGDSVTRLVVVLVALPLIVVSVQEAVRAIDVDLREMSAVFELSRWSYIRHVAAPGIASPVLAAASVTLGQALRVTVMAELLAASDGIGAEVSRSRTNLETADLFAWAIVLVAVVILIELLFIRPITTRLLRWRSAPAKP